MSDFVYAPPSGLDLIYEDRDILVVEKPPGLLSVPGKQHTDSALVRAQQKHGPLYAVHRLDMDTSGLLVFARRRKAERHLHAQFRNRQVEKEYIALVQGTLHGFGEITDPLRRLTGSPPRSVIDHRDGKEALTLFRARPLINDTSIVHLRPKTGRSHQLRVHLQHLGNSIVGDRFYGENQSEASRLHLHASQIAFAHPYSETNLVFKSPCPIFWDKERTKLMTPILKTPDLMLTPLAIQDADALYVGFNNWNVVSNLSSGIPWPYPKPAMKEFIEGIRLKMAQGVHSAWAIKRKGKAIGVIGVRHDAGPTTSRGFWLAEPYWGRGYMSQAVDAVEKFVFLELNLPSLLLKNLVSNQASRRLKEKSGATLIDIVELDHLNGEKKTEMWRLDREEWLAHSHTD